MRQNKETIANWFIRGQGIEIGALLHPMKIPEGASVKYVDRLSKEELRLQYPTLGNYDFVIACQYLEHTKNPIRSIVNMLRVIKNGGIIYLSIPDKEETFDKNRHVTTNEHLLDEIQNGTCDQLL